MARMTRNRITQLTLLSLFVSLGVFFLYVYVLAPNPEDFSKRAGSARKRQIRSLATALAIYNERHGQLPYSPAGSDAALYLAKDEFAVELSRFHDLPKVEFDDKCKSINNCPFEYLNMPAMSLERITPSLILVVEKPVAGYDGIWVVEASGACQFVPIDTGVSSQTVKSWLGKEADAKSGFR